MLRYGLFPGFDDFRCNGALVSARVAFACPFSIWPARLAGGLEEEPAGQRISGPAPLQVRSSSDNLPVWAAAQCLVLQRLGDSHVRRALKASFIFRRQLAA